MLILGLAAKAPFATVDRPRPNNHSTPPGYHIQNLPALGSPKATTSLFNVYAPADSLVNFSTFLLKPSHLIAFNTLP